MPTSQHEFLPLSDIRVDPECQTREAMNPTTIGEYVRDMQERGYDDFPPIVVFYDGTCHWLSDGFHRHAAATKAGLDSLTAEIREGSRRDAILYAVGANATHGLRRTRADKRRAVGMLLEDQEWGGWSNRKIADCCGVDEKLVRTLRSVSAAKPQIARKVERKGTVYEMETDRIGKKDGLRELLSTAPGRADDPDLTWLITPKITTSDDDTAEETGDERDLVSDQASGSAEAQLQELMSAWARASEEVQQQFLAKIGVAITRQVEKSPGLDEAEPLSESKLTPSAVPVPKPKQPTPEVPQNRLFKMWHRYKRATRKDGLGWVEAGCPSEYQDRNSEITNKLVRFRETALAAPTEEREQFIDLARRWNNGQLN